jgi:hypothetical protein
LDITLGEETKTTGRAALKGITITVP